LYVARKSFYRLLQFVAYTRIIAAMCRVLSKLFPCVNERSVKYIVSLDHNRYYYRY